MSLLIRLALLMFVVSSVSTDLETIDSDAAQQCKSVECDPKSAASESRACAKHRRKDYRTGLLRVDYYNYPRLACLKDDRCWNPTLYQHGMGDCPSDIQYYRGYRKLADKLPCPNSGRRNIFQRGPISEKPWDCRKVNYCRAWLAPQADPEATFEQTCFAYHITMPNIRWREYIEYFTYTDKECAYADACWEDNLVFHGYKHCLRLPMPGSRAYFHGRVRAHSRRPHVFGRE